MSSLNFQNETPDTSWVQIVKKYNRPNHVTSWVQLSANLFLYSLAWFLMYLSLSISWWITLGLSILAAGMLVRLFIIYHDLGHGSFFKSRMLSNWMGIFLGILTFTPYYSWSNNHHIHHETVGNLDKRGIGDVWTMTVSEFKESSRWKKIIYRFYRNPVTMFGIGPFYVFLIGNRFTKRHMDQKGRMGVYLTNAGLLLFTVSMSMLIGVKAFILIQFPIIYIAGILGFWLFYVQHQFNPSLWSRSDTWNYQKVALEGSSYYKLPRILQYFTGNIGFHHIHHLSPLIPNYNLSRCHHENALFNGIKPLRFWPGFKTITFRLWNEKTQEMISFRKLRFS
ncbi:MAG: fatty acid desaturase [Bacteroidetes bacterium]|nr:fatty acid desaturase [Bacteroidota bacterium]